MLKVYCQLGWSCQHFSSLSHSSSERLGGRILTLACLFSCLFFVCCGSGDDKNARKQYSGLVFLWSGANSPVPMESSLVSPRSCKLDDGQVWWADCHRRTWELAHDKNELHWFYNGFLIHTTMWPEKRRVWALSNVISPVTHCFHQDQVIPLGW